MVGLRDRDPGGGLASPRVMRLAFPISLLLTLAGMGFLTGCATLSPTPTIGMSVVNFRPGQSTLLETNLELTLRLTNETAQPLVLAGSSHKLFVNDSLVGRAVSGEQLTLPAFGSVTPTIVVHLENLTLLRKAKELSQTPRFVFRLQSRLQPAEAGLAGDINITTNGELDLIGLGLVPALPGR